MRGAPGALPSASPRPQLSAQCRLLAVRVSGREGTVKVRWQKHYTGEYRDQDRGGTDVHEDDR